MNKKYSLWRVYAYAHIGQIYRSKMNDPNWSEMR